MITNLKTISELAKAATPAPWQERFWHGPIDGELCIFAHGPIYTKTVSNLAKVGKDMELIAAARNAIDDLIADHRAMREALNRINKPDYGGVDGMIIGDMGLKHFTEHLADKTLAALRCKDE